MFAGTKTPETGTDLTSAASYTGGVLPTNVSDVLLKATAANQALITDNSSVIAESLNVTGTSPGTAYVVSNTNTTATNSTLTLGNSAGFTNAYSLVANDLLYATTSNLTIAGPNASTGAGTLGVVLASSGNFDAASGYSIIVTAAISGSGMSLTSNGAGTVELEGANTFSGTFTQSGTGTTELANGALASVSSVTVSAGLLTTFLSQTNTINDAAAVTLSGGEIDFSAGSETIGSLAGTSASAILNIGDYTSSSTATPPSTLYPGSFTVGANNTSTTFAGVISGTTASTTPLFTKTGTGSLTLSGANTYTGGTAINGGILQVASAQTGTTSGPLGASGTISFGGGTLQYSTANKFDYSARFSAAAGQTFNIDTNSQNVIFASAIGGATSDALTKLGAGTLSLTGTNAYTGITSINAGVLSLGSSGAIGGGGTVLFLGGTLQYTSANTTDVSSRFGTTAAQALNIDTNGQAVTFGSAFKPSSGGTLTKVGTGTLTLNSSSSTYTGGTTITAGTLLLNNTGATATASATGTGAVTIGAGAALASTAGAKGFVTGVVTTSGTGSVIAPGATATSLTGTVGTLTLNGGINLSAGATIDFDLGATQAASDLINITGGTITGSAAGQTVFAFNNTGAVVGTRYEVLGDTGATLSGVQLTDFTTSGPVIGTFSVTTGELDFTVTAVPEPTTVLGGGLLAAMAAGMGYRRRRRAA